MKPPDLWATRLVSGCTKEGVAGDVWGKAARLGPRCTLRCYTFGSFPGLNARKLRVKGWLHLGKSPICGIYRDRSGRHNLVGPGSSAYPPPRQPGPSSCPHSLECVEDGFARPSHKAEDHEVRRIKLIRSGRALGRPTGPGYPSFAGVSRPLSCYQMLARVLRSCNPRANRNV